jgi:TrmH family RNA methyltransferase
MENITSRSNPFITECIKLRDRGYRMERGLFVFEGKKLFDEAVSRGVILSAVLAAGKYISYCENALHEGQCGRLIEVPEMIYDKLSEEKSPDGIFCVAKTIDKYHEFATIYINISLKNVNK